MTGRELICQILAMEDMDSEIVISTSFCQSALSRGNEIEFESFQTDFGDDVLITVKNGLISVIEENGHILLCDYEE